MNMTMKSRVPMLKSAGNDIMRTHNSWRIPLANSTSLSSLTILKIGRTVLKDIRELKTETFSGGKPDGDRTGRLKPRTEAAVAYHQNSKIKIAVNSEGRRLRRLRRGKYSFTVRIKRINAFFAMQTTCYRVKRFSFCGEYFSCMHIPTLVHGITYYPK